MKPSTGEVGFEVDGKNYVLTFDMKAIAFFERETDMSIVDALAALEAAQEAGRSPKLSHLAYLMQAGLQRHHAGISSEDAMALAVHPAVQGVLGAGLQASMPGDDGGAEKNALAPDGTGMKSLKARSKRG